MGALDSDFKSSAYLLRWGDRSMVGHPSVYVIGGEESSLAGGMTITREGGGGDLSVSRAIGAARRLFLKRRGTVNTSMNFRYSIHSSNFLR